MNSQMPAPSKAARDLTSSTQEKVLAVMPRNRIATSISTEPAMVNKKNLTAA